MSAEPAQFVAWSSRGEAEAIGCTCSGHWFLLCGTRVKNLTAEAARAWLRDHGEIELLNFHFHKPSNPTFRTLGVRDCVG